VEKKKKKLGKMLALFFHKKKSPGEGFQGGGGGKKKKKAEEKTPDRKKPFQTFPGNSTNKGKERPTNLAREKEQEARKTLGWAGQGGEHGGKKVWWNKEVDRQGVQGAAKENSKWGGLTKRGGGKNWERLKGFSGGFPGKKGTQKKKKTETNMS